MTAFQLHRLAAQGKVPGPVGSVGRIELLHVVIVFRLLLYHVWCHAIGLDVYMVLIHIIFLSLLPETKEASRLTVFDSLVLPRFVKAILAQCVACNSYILPNPNPYEICQVARK